MSSNSISSQEIKTFLPSNDYFSKDVFDEEMVKVFERHWLIVGHISLIPEAGNYYVRQVGPESMIIARDDKGDVKAFFNVCRHRGYQIMDNHACGKTKGFVCPYHDWSYSNSGDLIKVPGSKKDEDFKFSNWSLHEAKVRVYQGFIFIWLSQDEPRDLIKDLNFADEEALSQVRPENMKLAHREVYTTDANWKTCLENNSECYHCARGGHPSLAGTCDFYGFYSDSGNTTHFPLKEGKKTFSMDGEEVCKIGLGDGNLPDAFSTGFLLMPMFCGPVFFKDHCVSLEMTPLDVDKTQTIAEWYVHKDAVEGVDYNINDLISVFHNTNKEDKVFAERNYKGMRSARHVPGPMHPRREDGVIISREMYDRLMKEE